MMFKKKAIALLLTAAMVFSMTGCQKQENTEEKNETQPASAVNESGTVEEAGKFDENGISAPGELPICEEPITISVFVKETADIADITQHTVFKELTEKTNIQFDFLVVPEDGAKEKLNMLLASGDYPEVIMGGGFTNADLVKYGTGEGILIPLNDLIEKQCVNLKERWADNPQIKEMMTSPDGNIYGIPAMDSGGMPHGTISYKLWMNTEWLKNVGMDMPETTEEFRQVLQAFKEQDANGNGDPNDEIPLSGATGTWAADIYLFLLNAFDYFNPDNGYLKLKDGKISGTADTEGLKKGLEYISELYADGLIDPAALTQDSSQLVALGNKEDVVLGAASCGHLGMFVNIEDGDRAKAYDNLLPLEGPDGYRGIPAQHGPQVSGAEFVITDKCQNPEAAIKLADLFCSEEWSVRTQVGIKGKQWDDADEGTFGADGETPATRKYLNLTTDASNETQDYKLGWVIRLLEPDWKTTFQVVGDINEPGNYEARLLQCTEKLRPYAADVDDIPPFFLDEETGTQISSMKTAIDDYVRASIVEFITGEKSVEKDWDKYLAGLDKLQYSDYIALNQKVYDDNYK